MERNFHKIGNREDFQRGSVSLKRGNDFQRENYLRKKKSNFQRRSYGNSFKASFEKEISLKNAKSKFLIILAILLLISIICSSKADAAIQSRPGFSALVMQDIVTQYKEIRELETSKGPMGLKADLDTTSYNDKSSTKNGIDVHMIKNTEWGAVVMLSLSSYGGGTQSNIQTYSTGSSNYTGVYGLGNTGIWERTMSMVSTDGSTINTTNSYASTFKSMGISSQYYDLYSIGSNATNETYDSFYKFNYAAAGGTVKSNGGKGFYGDGIYEMYSMLIAYAPSSYYRYVTYASGPFFFRGYSSSGGALSSSGSGGLAYSYYTTRAVVVSGAGL